MICDNCDQSTDVLVPMAVDYGEFQQPPVDEEWCPKCCAQQLSDEVYGLDPKEEQNNDD